MAAKSLITASFAYINGRIKVVSIVFFIIILMFIRCVTFSLKPSDRPLVLGIHIIDSAKQILRCSLHRSHQYSSRHFSKISHEKSVMFWMLHNGAKIFMKLHLFFSLLILQNDKVSERQSYGGVCQWCGSHRPAGRFSPKYSKGIGMRKDTFISLSFLDQILSVEFLSKISKLFWGENWHQPG